MSLRDSRIGAASAFRYASTGVANTAAGYAVIFGAMWMGIDPYLSNALGYAAGVVLAFLATRVFVFRSTGGWSGQTLRYGIAFCLSFGLNLLTLHFVVVVGGGAIGGQVVGGAAYALAMYLLGGWWVFRDTKPAGKT